MAVIRDGFEPCRRCDARVGPLEIRCPNCGLPALGPEEIASKAFASMDKTVNDALRGNPGEVRSILAEAGDVVHGARRKEYGSPLENHTRTARLWSAYLGADVTAEDVCMLNALQKISRQKHAPKRDNLVDLAGYAANVELIENERKQKP